MLVNLFLTLIFLYFAFSLALGFWLLITAIKQENFLKLLGLIFGWIIITGAAILFISNISKAITHKDNPGIYPCPMHKMMLEKMKNNNFSDLKENDED